MAAAEHMRMSHHLVDQEAEKMAFPQIAFPMRTPKDELAVGPQTQSPQLGFHLLFTINLCDFGLNIT